MSLKKDNLPLTLDNDGGATSTITYANEVIAIIAGVAANEVEGVAGMSSSGGGISDVFSRNKNITKGVKVEIGTEEASVDLYLVVEYGTPIQTAALGVQENVRKAIESMTGLHVVRVDVHVQGVSFEKENKENQASLDTLDAHMLGGSAKAESVAEAPVEQVEVQIESEVVETVETAEATEAPKDDAQGEPAPEAAETENE